MTALMKLRFWLYALGCALMGERELARIHIEVFTEPPDPEFLAELEAKKDYLKFELYEMCKGFQNEDPAFHGAMLYETVLFFS